MMGREFVYRSELPDRLACPKCGADHVILYGSKKVDYEEGMKGGKSEVWEVSTEMNIIYEIECVSCMNRSKGDEILDWRVVGECECGAKITRGNFVEGCDEGYEVEEVYECPRCHKRVKRRIIRGNTR